MARLEAAFDDAATGIVVFYYRDLFGRLWMATHPWSLFRVRVTIGARHEHHGQSTSHSSALGAL